MADANVNMPNAKLDNRSFPIIVLGLGRLDPGAEGLGIAAVELDAGRPWDSLGLSRRRGIRNGVHLEGALSLGPERRKDLLLSLLAQGLSLPGKEVQEEHKGRVEAAVSH